jgi:uncharacterized protein
MIYLDSCALLKLFREEEHSKAMADYVISARKPMVSSELARVEVCRTLHREGLREKTHERTDHLLGGIARIPLAPVIDAAADLPVETTWRSLDALHLATAQYLGQALTEFVSYDKRLVTAARILGLPIVQPGLTQ